MNSSQSVSFLDSKVVLITGSTTGIGESIAKSCYQQGAMVMVHGRNEQRAKQLAERLGERADYIIGDLGAMAQQNECRVLVERTVERFGRLDCLVNNAALTTRSDIDSASSEAFDTMMNVNVKAPMLLAQAAVNAYREQQTRGTIVNIGSMNAYCGQTDLLIYSMTKGAMMTMTRNLADALGKENIRINQLNVGWTVTPNEIELKAKEGLSSDWYQQVNPLFAPSGQLLMPEQVAEHVLFWLSERSAPVSGSVYDVEQYPLMGRNLINQLEG